MFAIVEKEEKMIHPSAIIHKTAKIAGDVEIGPYAVIAKHRAFPE